METILKPFNKIGESKIKFDLLTDVLRCLIVCEVYGSFGALVILVTHFLILISMYSKFVHCLSVHCVFSFLFFSILFFP